MIGWNDRRKSAPKFKNPAVEAVAKAGGIKAAPKKETTEVENISRVGTVLLGEASLGFRPKKTVVKGSKAEARAQKKVAWAEDYEKRANARYEAGVAKYKAKREAQDARRQAKFRKMGS